jgi:hypothetical protein
LKKNAWALALQLSCTADQPTGTLQSPISRKKKKGTAA